MGAWLDWFFNGHAHLTPWWSLWVSVTLVWLAWRGGRRS
jgi:hypothetical protein